MRQIRRSIAGFTLIELLVVMVIIATLLSVVAPRYFRSVDHAKEAALRSDLNVLRDALDKHYSDTGKYPKSLQQLVDEHYIRSIPIDPLSGSDDTWQVAEYPDHSKEGIFDVHSGAAGSDRDGRPYASW